ncbi:MAG: PilC/PilY family type IV pilus protein [Pseudomonadota bacterium]|nr:PilC/PilY family type IV pilus protein [Pseudomonadota bacterium]
MKRSIKAILSMSMAGLSFAPSTVLHADDTEVFVGGGTGTSGVKPNILFILDNSGSMSGSSYDEYGRPSRLSRMENMKVAFEEVMQNAEGLNVGLMSFNGNGGYMLYPVANIDDALTTPGTSGSDNFAFESNIGMTSGADDAVELKSSGNVYIDDETLTIAHTVNREAGKSITQFIQADSDNAEQYLNSNDRVYIDNQARFDMNSTQMNGLRFTNLNIPKGATIARAYFEFTSYFNADNHIYQRIWGENGDNPDTFTTDRGNISDRLANKTTAYTDWEIYGTTPWYSGQKYNSPDISNVIQEIIDQSTWDPDDALVFIFEHITGTGHRAGTLSRSNNGSTTGADGTGTKLIIEYNTDAEPEVAQTVGLRFDNIDIPSGATVTNARIDFVSAADNATADDLQIQVKIENAADAQPFTDARYSLSSRTKFGDVVTWHPDDDWDYNQTVQGPDVTSLVQRVVSSTSGWCGGNAMAFYLEPSTATDTLSRLAHAYEAGIGKKATLTVSYTGGENGCIERNWSSRINSSENDAYQDGASWRSGYTYNDTNTITYDSDHYIGLRFENVPITQGMEVIEAYIEYTASSSDSGSTTMTIVGDKDSSASAFPQSRYNVTNRTFTDQYVNWSLDSWDVDQTYQSPDLSAIINEITSQSDWAAGNALAFISATNNSRDRQFWSFDGSSGKAAKLVIKASDGGIESETNTVRYYEIGLVNDLDPRGMTPITGSLYEAAMYYTGGAVTYGKDRDNSRYGRVSHELSYTGGTLIRDAACTDDNLDSQRCSSEYISGSPMYTSPITSACQTSHVVVLTDGAANQNQASSNIKSLTGITNCDSDASIGGEKCARSLVRWMANSDLRTDLSGNDNTVKTHTIAFNLSSPVAVNFLQDLAREGDGGFYNVNTAQDLTTAFDTIIQSVRSTAATFVAPGATVNQFNRLSHRNEVYFSVFKPDSAPRWAGNLKRYKLLGNPAVISDANDKAAVDSNTGYFKETAQSVWSDAIDGAYVAQGGAASQRPTSPDDLNIYTWLQSSGLASKDLTSAINKVHETNGAITKETLGVSDVAERNEVLRWTRGVDVLDWDSDADTSEVRTQYEDPLHSVPHIVTYGGTNENPDTTIFFGTNGGYLHAVNGATGEEVFSFVPETQLPKMLSRYNNTERFTHPYGVDGSPASWVHDVDGDNQIEPNAGDFVYVYFGMRRGGNEYYALDVSDRDQPKVLWRIQGGTGDFAELGQTWSTPLMTSIKQGTETKRVLVFGGGYDTAYDDASFTGSTSTGNAIFVVDAKTGERLWYASSTATTGYGQRMSDMQHPIPSDIAIIDLNGDGMADQLYAADVNGQIFRFDIHENKTGGDWIQGGVIADLGGDTAPNNRRFFNSPDVSLTSIAKQQKLAIAIGSGSRANPLSRITQDRFYVILQDGIYTAPENYEAITHTDLIDQTSSISTLGIEDAGWYFDLPNSGEKVMSPSVTVAGKILFTTYSPDSSASSCNPVVGTGRAYVVHLTSSSAVADLDEDGSLEDTQDRSKTLASGNIPPSPKVLFPEDGAPVVLVGPEQPLENVDLGLVDEWTQIYRRPEDPD